MVFTLRNQSTTQYYFMVFDENDHGNEIFSDTIAPWGDQPMSCLQNESGFGHIKFQKDENVPEYRSFIKEGDIVIA